MPMPKGLTREDLRAWYAAFELWFTKSTRIAVVMARGAYWLGERKRLMTALGMKTFEQMEKGAVDPQSLDAIAGQLNRMNERLEAEEKLIQEIRSSGDPPAGEDDENRTHE